MIHQYGHKTQACGTRCWHILLFLYVIGHGLDYILFDWLKKNQLPGAEIEKGI